MELKYIQLWLLEELAYMSCGRMENTEIITPMISSKLLQNF
jgi:hypothetical protein